MGSKKTSLVKWNCMYHTVFVCIAGRLLWWEEKRHRRTGKNCVKGKLSIPYTCQRTAKAKYIRSGWEFKKKVQSIGNRIFEGFQCERLIAVIHPVKPDEGR